MARTKDRYTPFTEDEIEKACDDYDPFNDNSYITCYPGAEKTYREPWFDPDMEPIYYTAKKPVYRFSRMTVIADGTGESDKDRLLVYQGERLVAEFPTRSVIVLSHLSGGYFLYADSNQCQFEFVFEDSAKALEACNAFCRLGVI